jgi:hypothetical protein
MTLTGRILSVGEHYRDDEECHGVFVEVSKEQLRQLGMGILCQEVTVEAKPAIGAVPSPTPSTGSILLEICAEVDRATATFPTWPTDALHAVGVVAEEMGELQKEIMQLTYEPHKSTPATVRKEAVQLAAMSLRFLRSLDRYEYLQRPQHSQDSAYTPSPAA